jgi:hypothetical protein
VSSVLFPARTPPLEPLLDAVGRLEARGLACALGGSGLLAALGLADHVRDWDVTTDAPIEAVRAALDGLEPAWKGSDEIHADQKLMLGGGVVEVIVGFAFHAGGGVVRIPTMVSGRLGGVPLGSPEAWAVAYALLGREEKSRRLLGWLAGRGADERAVARMLDEPLPGSLAERLRALPRAAQSRAARDSKAGPESE